jgi:hypothetical protein
MTTEAVQYAVFGSIIPAVTYNFKFWLSGTDGVVHSYRKEGKEI